MHILFSVVAFVIGACFGSFFCCQARRLHLKSTKKEKLGNRSTCLKCKTKLKWFDNIPIISWLALKGKCRKCGKKIGIGEIVSEILTGLAFLLIYCGMVSSGVTIDILASQPLSAYFAIVAAFLSILCLIFLAIYDGLYGELPTAYLITAIIFSIILVLIRQWPISSDLLSVAILGGTYLVLYLISKGKWVGDGDWILCISLGLLLGSPWLALIALFLSNFLACLVMLPLTKGKNHKIPFGPFLVSATIIILSFHDFFNYVIISLW